MGKMERNNYCGLCMECVKSCPNDNITLYSRPFATSDILIKGYDEVWKACIMLVLAISYSVVLLGPWGELKDWANVAEVGDWAGFSIYAATQALAALVVFPFLYYVSIVVSRWYSKAEHIPIKELFLKYSYMLVPMGLLAWVAFSVPLLMVNGSYIISVTSDPLGWGMDLFGTADFPWTPLMPAWVPWIQAPILLLGLYYGVRGGYKAGVLLFSDRRQLVRSLAPPTALLVLVTIGFLKSATARRAGGLMKAPPKGPTLCEGA